ncbi:adenine phosphoribosyltransferase [Pseudomaricurvus sp.]|uniref:adenine phosphoribosyltransferase n=1 Tax=Pseudomaricurvus sp. TaxID=2004510 RepID=UPI003F6B24FF
MPLDEFLLKSHLPVIQDWPKPGVQFRDITPLFRNPKAARHITDELVLRYMDSDITHIAALEARGFLLGSNLAYALNKPLILLRKAGKLPGAVDHLEYSSEYAQGRLELQKDSFKPGDKVLIVDDVLATGQTLYAAAQLIHDQGATITEIATIVDLSSLGGREHLTNSDLPTFSLLVLED